MDAQEQYLTGMCLCCERMDVQEQYLTGMCFAGFVCIILAMTMA
jgi:hypothetical protein